MPRVKLFDKNEVLNKAMLLFWKKGYHATSVQDLVDFLGINRGSLYDTYGGKKKLFDQTIDLYTTTNQIILCDFLKTEKNVRETLRIVFQKIVNTDLFDDDCKGCFVVNTTTELLPNDTALQKVIIGYQQEIVQLFYNLLQMGVEIGEISKNKDIRTIANLLYTLMTGLRVVSKTAASKEESLASVDAVLSLLD